MLPNNLFPCFQRHQWGKSESLFHSPLVPVLGAACEVMWWTAMRWNMVPPHIRVFFHEWDYKKTRENGASQFPSQSKELKATTGICCLCVCVSLSVCVSGSFPGLLRVKWEGCEWSVFQNWAMRSCWHIHLKRNSLFSKVGVGWRNSPAGEAVPGGEGLSWGRGLRRCRALPARRQQQLTGTPPATTLWLWSRSSGLPFQGINIFWFLPERALSRNKQREPSGNYPIPYLDQFKAIFEWKNEVTLK